MENINLPAGQEGDHVSFLDSNGVEGGLRAKGQKTMAVREQDFEGALDSSQSCHSV